MKRRTFLTAAGLTTVAGPVLGAQPHHHAPVTGPQATTTVSFGAWPSDPPLNRTALPPGPPPNVHAQIPYTATIKAGGTVNFMIAGLHQLAVYAPGTTMESIDETLLKPMPGAPPFLPPVIDDPTNRVYLGPYPFGLPEDRVEVVHFGKPGIYLAVCVFLPHFEEGMHGWVRVLP